MVFAEMFRQKVRREGREEGRREAREEEREQGRVAGLEEAHAAWREWNRRREEAIAEGKPFDEHTPDLARGTDPPDSERLAETSG